MKEKLEEALLALGEATAMDPDLAWSLGLYSIHTELSAIITEDFK